MRKALNLAAAIPWAISAEWLATILTIAAGEGPGPEAVSTQLGRPLENTQATTMRGDVAVVPVTGPIFRRANMFTEISGATSLQLLARDFAAAVADPKVKAILLDIDSPGGEASGINEFAAQVFAARASKPVYAYVGGVGASAAYWIASAAEKIVVDATARVGSIGVVQAVPNPDAKAATEIEIVSSQSPDKRPDVSTKAGRAVVQASVDALADVFIDAVATYRGVTPKVVASDFGRGGVLVGAGAVKAGLVDSIGSLEGTIAALQSKPAMKGSKRMSASLLTTLATIFALSADASESDVIEAARECATAKKDRANLLTAAKSDDVMLAVGAIETAIVEAAKVPALEEKLQKQQAELDAKAHAALVATLRAEGKLTAHMEEMAAEMTLPQLQHFAEKKAKPIPHLVAKDPEEKPNDAPTPTLTVNGKPFEALSNMEKHEIYNTDRPQFEAIKADWVRRGSPTAVAAKA